MPIDIPHGHWKTTTLVAGLRLDGIAAPFVLDGPIARPSRLMSRTCWCPSSGGLWDAIARLIDSFSPQECANYFTAAGYEPE